MRIAILGTRGIPASYGGFETFAEHLSTRLVARGHDVFVALRPTNEWQDRLDFLPAENFLHTSIRNSFGMLSVRRISRFIDSHQIDIVHAHVARDYMAASIAARSARNVKLVLTRHAASPLKPFYRFAISNLNAAIAVSPVVADELVKVFPKEKLRVIPNGLEIAPEIAATGLAGEFRHMLEIPDGEPVVAAVGELTLQKGQRDLVLAANEIVKRVPDCHFVIVGDDNSIDRHFRRELKRLVKVLGLETRFHWLDHVDDTSGLVAATDIMVSTAHADPPGVVILDAMAAGKAVISTDTEGARELISHHDALTPIKDPVALADKICVYLKDDEQRSKLGADLRAGIAERFGLTQMADDTERTYRDVLSIG